MMDGVVGRRSGGLRLHRHPSVLATDVTHLAVGAVGVEGGLGGGCRTQHFMLCQKSWKDESRQQEASSLGFFGGLTHNHSVMSN